VDCLVSWERGATSLDSACHPWNASIDLYLPDANQVRVTTSLAKGFVTARTLTDGSWQANASGLP
jgi:hypothetical protein